MGMHKIKLTIVGVAVLLLAAPEIAYASDCPPGGALDCYGTLIAALLAVVAIVAIIAVIVFLPEIVAAAGVIEAGEVAAVGAEAAEAAEVGAEAAEAAEVAEAAEAAEAEVTGASPDVPEGFPDDELPGGPPDKPPATDGIADDVTLDDFYPWPKTPPNVDGPPYGPWWPPEPPTVH